MTYTRRKLLRCHVPWVLLGCISSANALDANCQPTTMQKLRLTMSTKVQERNFWIEQLNAIEKDNSDFMALQRYKAIQRQFDREVHAVERRRAVAERSAGVSVERHLSPQDKQWLRETDRDMDRMGSETDALIGGINREMAANHRAWYARCKAYAEAQIRRAE